MRVHRHIGGLEKSRSVVRAARKDGTVHRHIGGLESDALASDLLKLFVHRHIGGLENV